MDDYWGELQSVSRDCFKEATIQESFHDHALTIRFTSLGVGLRYKLHKGENNVSSSELFKKTITDCCSILNDESESVRKNIIHTRGKEEALSLLSVADTKEPKDFWQGYFFAEHWDNKDALEVFKRLNSANAPVSVVHWYGNLLGKLGYFSLAREPLEQVAAREPNRYNHFSHLGNIYRGLKMYSEARDAYLKAISLIGGEPLNRVEMIHLFRCYHGLTRLGYAEYGDKAENIEKKAILSGEVKKHELERIMF